MSWQLKVFIIKLLVYSAKYQLATLDSIERRAKRLIGDPVLIDAKLQTFEHRRKVARLSVFYRIVWRVCEGIVRTNSTIYFPSSEHEARAITPSTCC